MIGGMTRLPAALAAFVLLTAAAPVPDRRFTVTDFDRVQVEGPFVVTLRTGVSPSAVAKGDSNVALDRVAIEVQGRLLKVRPNRSAWGGGDSAAGGGPVTIELGGYNVRWVSVIGSARLAVDRLEGQRVDISLSGNGEVRVGAVEADNLVLGAIGAGAISLAGSAKNLRATVLGSASLDGSSLVAEDANLTTDTSGATIVGARRSAKVRAIGIGETRVLGSPACTVEAGGLAQVVCGD